MRRAALDIAQLAERRLLKTEGRRFESCCRKPLAGGRQGSLLPAPNRHQEHHHFLRTLAGATVDGYFTVNEKVAGSSPALRLKMPKVAQLAEHYRRRPFELSQDSTRGETCPSSHVHHRNLRHPRHHHQVTRRIRSSSNTGTEQSVPASGYSSVWLSTRFGSERTGVQIALSRRVVRGVLSPSA